MRTASIGTLPALLVDDESRFAEIASELIKQNKGSISVETTASVSEGFDRPIQEEFDCILSDHDMPEKNDIEFRLDIQERDAELPLIRFTGKGLEKIASEESLAGVTDYLQKEKGPDQYAVLANRIVNTSKEDCVEDRLKQRKTQDEAASSVSCNTLTGVEIKKLFDNAVVLVSDQLACGYADILKHCP